MHPSPSPADDEETPPFHDTVVQLTENFRLNPDLGEFVSTIYSRRFKPQKVQARQLAAALSLVASDRNKEFGIEPKILGPVQNFLTALSDVMYRRPQSVLTGPEVETASTENKLDSTLNGSSLHRPVSLALVRLRTWSSTTDHIAYELHVNREAALAAALVASLQRCSPDDDIFVATPHRIQREAVKAALSRVKPDDNLLEHAFGRLQHGPQIEQGKVTVDTIERLQGSEAAFVICLFSLPYTSESTADLGFLLERRRLNVAISRAKTLCILISSKAVLCPSMKVLVNEETAKGYAFLKAFEKRAWSYDIPLNVDHLL
ncbi:hypothetical protein BYT27DRAFT_7101848 [Phlegmacium glaucopus]|nr:hypothetical protein BYT27DRAFT_7101848 [Phlegmacium glaucopus]